MIAVLLFSGKSQRFWPLCEKSLFPIWGTNLLERQIQKLKAAGFREIILVGGSHNLKEAKKFFPNQTFVKQSDSEPGMRGALLAALPRCKRNAVLIVSANDVIEGSAFEQLRRRGEEGGEGGLILARRVKTYFPGGYLKTKGKRILSIVEKPGVGEEPSSLVNIVAHVHADAAVLLAALRKISRDGDDGYEVTLDTLFKTFPYEAVSYSGSWQPVKYPWHLLDLLPMLPLSEGEPQRAKSATVHRTAMIEGPVVLGGGVKVMAHATIVGPCFIGEGTIVANNALVRGSSIGARCVVGYNTEVARSILADDVWTHSSYIGDSIVGSNVSMGAGTTTGNLRLDGGIIASQVGDEQIATGRAKFGAIIGNGCRTGVHTCFSPGVKIGSSCFIHSCELVMADVPDGSFLKDGKIRPNRHDPPIALERRSHQRKSI